MSAAAAPVVVAAAEVPCIVEEVAGDSAVCRL